MRKTYIIFLVAIATCLRGGLSDEDIPAPEPRLISTFQIVRFPNDACVGTNNRNGTCYTSAECSDKGGASQGSCADGFGVCCTTIITTCGQTSSENITYWDQTPTVITTGPSHCQLKVCPMNDHICQLRIDFTTFVITGPSTTTIVEGAHQLGTIPTNAGAIAGDTDTNWRGNCLLDTFSVNGVSSSNNPPTICGTNTALHMYVDANPQCNSMTFQFSALAGPAPAAAATETRGLATLAARDWDMTITQFECGHLHIAPPGCTQYVWDSPAGVLTTFNWAGGTHLANQNQKMCIRRERGVCFCCFARDANAISFEFGGESAVDTAFTAQGQACGYSCEGINGIAAAGNMCGSYDCAIIPGAFVVANAGDGTSVMAAQGTGANLRSLAAALSNVPCAPQITSNGAFNYGVTVALAIGDLNTPWTTIVGEATLSTICTSHAPYMLHFKSDSWEGQGIVGEHIQASTGINLNYQTFTCV